ncbi:YTH domain-containing protein ECT1-like [Impatiens glandulifera]|uniref:YTH domain-containing protein ECT1-like n=1 Tax=Impatiens glandulifera TaxID=253017 RepID=UPI001FB13081|nr:YTH domain-containing protein ECT1-like [Impatiens glandulifera]
MEGATKQGQDRISLASTSASASASIIGRKPAETNLKEQSVPPKDERTLSANTSSEAPKIGPVKDQAGQLESSTTGTFTSPYPLEQTYYYGGYENNTSNWNEYQYVGANGLQVVPPAMFNDNPSMLYQSGYGLDSQVAAYGQFSPMANPMSPIMFDGQLFSPHQVPVSPSYFLPPVSPGLPPLSPALPSVSQPELMTTGNNSGQEIFGEMLYGPGPGYFLHYGALGGVGLPGDQSNRSNSSDASGYITSLTSPSAVYPQPYGILGPYDHNFGQYHQEQRPYNGLGMSGNSSTRKYPSSGGSYQSSGYNVGPIDRRGRYTPDKSVKQERNRETTFMPADAHVMMSGERNRGPRASNLKGKNATEESGSAATPKISESVSGTGGDNSFNLADFTTEYKNAKFFIIKSFSEDNVHKSVKYNVWSSTPLGNRKLDAAYFEAKEQKEPCPVFLFFSVNASGQFCGVAEMIGPVDFENNAEYWQQDRWSGQFPVKWHILKDVPNGRFRHILVETNENKPVTHSRDSQEVKVEQGIEMLKIFKDYNLETSILDDFNFYNEREKMLLERKARQQQQQQQQQSSSKNATSISPDSFIISQLPEKFAEAVQLGDSSSSSKVVQKQTK